MLRTASSGRWVAEQVVGPMFGEPTLVRRRLGQGGFKILVGLISIGDTVPLREKKTLPVLQAAHIRPVSAGGLHQVDNGLLLRSDIHALFDGGYATVTPDHRFRVSRRVREEWHNGRVYYELDGSEVRLPRSRECWPNREALEWHAETVFKG